MFDAQLNNGEVFKQGSLEIVSKDCIATGEHDWRVDGYHDIKQSLTDKAFPCLFGRRAFRSGTTLFSFIGDDNMETDIVNCMKRYVEFVEHTSIEDRLFSPLIVMFECQSCKTLQESHSLAWQALQYMHDNDPAPWPESIPRSPENGAWSFCFGGIELFVNISCPEHYKMKSRNLGRRITLIINPRSHFDVVASQKSLKGVRIRDQIRKRSQTYNDGHISDALGFYDDADNLEWKQYQLREPATPALESCPLLIRDEDNQQ